MRKEQASHVPGETPAPPRLWLRFGRAYWLVTTGLVVVGLALVAWYVPDKGEPGWVHKVFYFHLPVALTMFFACFVVFAASALYLWKRETWCDDLAHAATEVAVLYCSAVLLTGMIWAKEAWGSWWVWTPRLTLSLVLWLFYVVYLVGRPWIRSPDRRAVVCAVYGVLAFLDVPLVYFSVLLMPEDPHPVSLELTPPMLRTVVFWMLPMALACVGVLHLRYRLLRQKRLGTETEQGKSPPA